jgi:hypothetical protein
MSTWQDGFKVVYRGYDNDLLSAISTISKCCLRYEIGIETKPLPRCGPLAAFSTLKAAQCFIVHLSPNLRVNRRIYRCRYTRSRQRELYVTYGKARITAIDIPQDTVFATRVIITEEDHTPFSVEGGLCPVCGRTVLIENGCLCTIGYQAYARAVQVHKEEEAEQAASDANTNLI